MRIVLLGAPGAGKGTQCKRIVEKYALQHFSSGDILRQERKAGSELGKKAQSYMDSGALVPDELIVAMMAKAIGEMGGCLKAAGMDLKNFCAGPASALMTAAALVKSGLFENVVVVGGGSLAKLGMKFQAFLEHDLPILDDCLAAIAFLVTADDGLSPRIRLEAGAVGTVPVGAGTSDEAVFRHYLLKPLQNLGLKCRDIDRYAVELQNPEIMEYSGSGDVAAKNYRKIAALAVRSGELEKGEMKAWIKAIGMPGFAPTQGHIPSAVPYLGHALAAFANGEVERVMFLSRASLFLGRCTNLLDGVSFILERNPKISKIYR